MYRSFTDKALNKYVLFVVFAFGFALNGFSQYTIKGKIVDERSKQALEFVSIQIPVSELWSISNEKGDFVLNRVPQGKAVINVQYLGYAPKTVDVDVQGDISNLVIALQESNLLLDEVVISAQRKSDSDGTTYTIDRTALDHAQVVNVNSIGSLLPGGKSVKDPSLTIDNRIVLRGETGEMGNASFGTAVTVDGVRLQNNSELNETKGTDLRNVSSSNIESVEIVTGIPSVEYGDLSNGIVKVNTRKGKTPFYVETSLQPKTKQFALSKGFLLGDKAGTLNTSLERTKSTSNLASPYTAYDRNSLSLTYTNTLNRDSRQPLSLQAGFTGNIGGYNSEADPDAFQETYTKTRDHTLRGNLNLNWLLNLSWITNLSFSASMSRSDKQQRVNTNKNSASTQPLIHSREEGYFIATSYDENPNAEIILGPTGYWYQLAITDNKPVSHALKLKADWSHKWGEVQNKLMAGTEWTSNGNNGRGLYYDDLRYAPTWREYRYDELPFMNNIAAYLEDRINVPVGKNSSLQFTAGLRHDITYIRNSEYGTASSLSPRVNTKYIVIEKAKGSLSHLNFYAGYGKAVKLPSFEVLYPSPSYSDKLSFAPGTMSDGTSFLAYYSIPAKAEYNPNLKWQYTRQMEIGAEATVEGTRISLSFFRNKTFHPYMSVNQYTPYTYKLTTQEHLDNCEIPSANRIYAIDRTTGIVTVSDKTDTYAARDLGYNTRNTFKTNTIYTNGAPVDRKGLEWVVDFSQIHALKTQFRIDGNYYYYKGVDETLIPWMPSSTANMADGNPYKYVGYYAGSNVTSVSSTATASVVNGSLSRQLNTNLTVTTHIPKIRMILSVKIESSLYHYTKMLSERSDGYRSFAMENVGDLAGEDYDIYGRDKYVATYPLYYSTWEEPDVRIPFAEKFAWAKENDIALYNELAKLVVKSNTNYYFNPNQLSSYFCANINLTKEIGDIASISFYAYNFLNNMSLVKSSQSGLEQTLYNSAYIPQFQYGLSLRFKL
jgi:hypothetical protein